MKNKMSKQETKEVIKGFFSDIKDKNPKDIKKIKKLAMSKNISLKEKRKLFCRGCFAPYSGKEKVRIRREIKSVECEKCGHVERWRLQK